MTERVLRPSKVVFVTVCILALMSGQPVARSVALSRVDVPLGTGSAAIQQSSMAAADFDTDGDKELVVGDVDGNLYVVSHDGSNWAVGWQRNRANVLRAVRRRGYAPTRRGFPGIRCARNVP